jgi:hypothetical protein
MVLKPISAICTSHKALRDEDLSWDQMEIGATRLLHHMHLYQWPDVATDMLAVFWYKLQNHEMRNCPNRQRILKVYQAQVHCEWHATLDRKDPSFNISLINDALLTKITWEAFKANDSESELTNNGMPDLHSDYNSDSDGPVITTSWFTEGEDAFETSSECCHTPQHCIHCWNPVSFLNKPCLHTLGGSKMSF